MIYVFYAGTLLAEYPDDTPWKDMDTPYDSWIRYRTNQWTHQGRWYTDTSIPTEYRAAALLLT